MEWNGDLSQFVEAFDAAEDDQSLVAVLRSVPDEKWSMAKLVLRVRLNTAEKDGRPMALKLEALASEIDRRDPNSSRAAVIQEALARLPVPPARAYDWDRFYGDQVAKPLMFHGTSTLYRTDIEQYGLAFARRPYDNSEVAEVVRIFQTHRVHGPHASEAVLQVYTASTARAAAVSLSFDWIRACRYALYRGGETMEQLLTSVEWILDPERADILSADEHAFLSELNSRISATAHEHTPLVVGVEMPDEWLAAEPFFSSREAFLEGQKLRAPFRGQDLLAGNHSVTGASANGKEFRVSDAPAEWIKAWVTFEATEEIRAAIRSL